MRLRGRNRGYCTGVDCDSSHASRFEGAVTTTSILLALVLSSCAFLLPDQFLITLCVFNAILIMHGLSRKGSIAALIQIFTVQLGITMTLYYLLHGQGQMIQGLIAVLRVMLAFIPGWWLSVTSAPEKIGRVLTWVLPAKWAFVIGASLGLLPFMIKEAREIYQVQCLRGARITSRALRNPRNWHELVTCVLLPLLIQLLKLSKQMATAAQLRYYGTQDKPTHWKL